MCLKNFEFVHGRPCTCLQNFIHTAGRVYNTSQRVYATPIPFVHLSYSLMPAVPLPVPSDQQYNNAGCHVVLITHLNVPSPIHTFCVKTTKQFVCDVNRRQILEFRIFLFRSLYIVTYKMRRRRCSRSTRLNPDNVMRPMSFIP